MSTEVDILLVEDNLSDAELTIRALKKHHVLNELLHVKDGVEALEYIFGQGKFEGRNLAKQPKVILLDLKMPRINGIEVLEKIKSDERTQRIPVVILTSSKEDPDIQRCYALGANSYVVKPVGFDSFAKAVSDLGMYWMMINEPPR